MVVSCLPDLVGARRLLRGDVSLACLGLGILLMDQLLLVSHARRLVGSHGLI